MTKAEKAHLNRVASLGCILCYRLGYAGTPAEIHHPRANMGLGQRGKHRDGIPLCTEHHRGATGFHGLGKRAFERRYGVTETELVEQVKGMVEKLNG